jgi:hypothetical protein
VGDVRKDALGVFPFGQQKEAGITVGKVPREGLYGSMGAVDASKGVTHIHIGPPSKEASKIRVVFRFAGVEAEIFQENDLAGRVG